LDRYKYFDRYPEFSKEEYRVQAEFFLQILEKNLAPHNFLIDDEMRFADVAIFPFIRQFANTDREWFDKNPYKHVQHWLNTCIQTTIFEAIMATNKVNS
jgi:glutathione S-transferase